MFDIARRAENEMLVGMLEDAARLRYSPSTRHKFPRPARYAEVEAMLDGDYAEHATRELRRRADANPDNTSSSEDPLDSDDDAATVEAASAETAPDDAHSWCVIS